MSTNVPPVTWTDLGFQSPVESDLVKGALADINAAFGGDLNVTNLSTPQGQLASSEAAVVGAMNDTFAFMANQTDPSYSSGRMQDGIGRIYFLERNPALPTVVQAQCIGLAGTIIPPGSVLAQDSAGNLYTPTSGGTIPAGGTITLAFQCTVTGPTPCPAGALVRIYRGVPGWDTVGNALDGVIGTVVESRAAFEARRYASVAGNSNSQVASVRGALLALPNVLDAFTAENTGFGPTTTSGVLLAPNSLYACVAGGDPNAIANAIWNKKSPGCATNGAQTVYVQDTAGYQPPYPSYAVQFDVAQDVTICFSVLILNGPGVPANAQALVAAAIVQAFGGADGGPPARIGQTILAARFYNTVTELGTWARLRQITVGNANLAACSFQGSVSGTTLSVSAVNSGALALGQTIYDTSGALVSGTQITALGTGIGGVGTYTVSAAQSVTSEAMTAVLPAYNSVPVNMNQIPVTDANNISVTLA